MLSNTPRFATPSLGTWVYNHQLNRQSPILASAANQQRISSVGWNRRAGRGGWKPPIRRRPSDQPFKKAPPRAHPGTCSEADAFEPKSDSRPFQMRQGMR